MRINLVYIFCVYLALSFENRNVFCSIEMRLQFLQSSLPFHLARTPYSDQSLWGRRDPENREVCFLTLYLGKLFQAENIEKNKFKFDYFVKNDVFKVFGQFFLDPAHLFLSK